jgi:hypothetical protein
MPFVKGQPSANPKGRPRKNRPNRLSAMSIIDEAIEQTGFIKNIGPQFLFQPQSIVSTSKNIEKEPQ